MKTVPLYGKVAALAYDEAARQLFGEYAYLNFPETCIRGASPSSGDS